MRLIVQQVRDLGLESRHTLVRLDALLARSGLQLAPLGGEGGAHAPQLGRVLFVHGQRCLCDLLLESGGRAALMLERALRALRRQRQLHQLQLRLDAQLPLGIHYLPRERRARAEKSILLTQTSGAYVPLSGAVGRAVGGAVADLR